MKIRWEVVIFIAIMFYFGLMGFSDADHIGPLKTIREEVESIDPILIDPPVDEQRWVVSKEQLESLCSQFEEVKRKHVK